MSETNERSVASAGSVEPVAWVVIDSRFPYPVISTCRDSCAVPVYRSPTLTDAEREAMRFFLEKHRKIQREGEHYCCLEASPHADAIQGLLERLAGEHAGSAARDR